MSKTTISTKLAKFQSTLTILSTNKSNSNLLFKASEE